MILVTGEVQFATGEIERLKHAMAKNIAATRAEPGCARYDYAVDLANADRLHVVEEWADEAALDAHMASPHMAEFMAAFATAQVDSVSIRAYESHYLRTLIGAAPEPAD